MPGGSVFPVAAIEGGIRDACEVIGVEDDPDKLVRQGLTDSENRALIVVALAVIRLVDERACLRERISQLEERLRGHGIAAD